MATSCCSKISIKQWLLTGMIVSGSIRTVAVKAYYQMGFEKPFFVTILFHVAGLPAFFFFCLSERRRRERDGPSIRTNQEEEESPVSSGDVEEAGCLPEDPNQLVSCSQPTAETWRLRRADTVGSRTGITEESHLAANSLLDKIRPKALHVVLPGVLNLATYICRWTAVLYVPASVAEMLMNGLELVLSALFSRWIRKRNISRLRWLGVGIVTAGLLIIGFADYFQGEPSKTSSSSNPAIGSLFILGTGLFGTCLAMAEELLTQEGGYSVFWIMGNEGLWGLVLGLALYYPLAPLFHEDPHGTWVELTASTRNWAYSLALTAVFTTAGMLSICAIQATSSMTRNIWQHLRAIPIWFLGLLAFYAFPTVNELGEPWTNPYSWIILGGFLVMVAGVYVYYMLPQIHGVGTEAIPE